ncbi:DNA-binding protein DDB_G0278111-like [Triticum dicoccoides]|nr:DNA-binding protein DDB_G0278111-like [Triticum dicoccoides]
MRSPDAPIGRSGTTLPDRTADGVRRGEKPGLRRAHPRGKSRGGRLGWIPSPHSATPHPTPPPRDPLRCGEDDGEAIPALCTRGVMADHDPELEAIRQRRMQELMGQRGGAASPQNAGQQKAQEDAKLEAEERRQMMLAQILSSEARERISRIALVKPDKARGVEDVLLRAAQTGGISEKVSEERLISLLEQINTHTSKQTKVTIQRRRFDDDD